MNTKPIIIFGNSQIAELAEFYLRHDAARNVAAFTVDGEYVKNGSFCGRPVVPFEDIDSAFGASDYDAFVALAYTNLNALRAQKYYEMKAKGYQLVSYVSSRATVWPGFEVGDNCFILEDNTLQPYTRIGNNVTLWSGNHIGHHSIVHDHCFLASHIVVSGGVEIGEYCFLGVNATLRDQIRMGAKCVVGAGTLMLSDAEPEGVYMGQGTERSKVPSTRLKRI